MDAAQALLDRRRRALKRKKAGFERLMRNFRDLDVEVISGKPSRSEADDDEDPDERPEPVGGEAACGIRGHGSSTAARAAAGVIQLGGRRRRFCDGCLRRLMVRMRRQKQVDRFIRRFDRVRRPR